MPPKKKGKGGKKKAAAKEELTVEDKYQKTLREIESLKDRLAYHTDFSRRKDLKSQDMREKMLLAEDAVEIEQKNKLEISADLTRQYKTMQAEMTLRIHSLQQEYTATEEKLAHTETELRKEKENSARIIKEKDDIITQLEFKINHLESAYENLLHDAFDEMASRVETLKKQWSDEIYKIQINNKELLSAFGLNPLDI